MLKGYSILHDDLANLQVLRTSMNVIEQLLYLFIRGYRHARLCFKEEN